MSDASIEFSEAKRFAANELVVAPDASLRHFIPLVESSDKVHRDRFGNRVFTSPDKGYVDRLGNINKAALLVSSQGESFITKNPGILRDIDKGLTQTILASDNSFDDIDLGNGRLMRRTMMGKGQSQILILEAGSEKFIIKHKKADNTSTTNISQPYFNEMLQSQALGQDLTQELAAEGVEMPTFLFASGQISCTRFEEGSHPNETLLRDKLERFLPRVDNYISNQKSQLWAGIHSDAKVQTYAPTTTVIKADNFIQRPDGVLVWVDPFYFVPIVPDPRALSPRAQLMKFKFSHDPGEKRE